MEILTNQTVGDIVREEYGASEVFRKYKIDFCCGGGKSIEEACANKNIDIAELLSDLEQIGKQGNPEQRFNKMPSNELADYIERVHHTYVSRKIPELKQLLWKIVRVHGDNHPELEKVQMLFEDGAGELTAHMKKEELILFPAVRKIAKAFAENVKITASPIFGSVAYPINMMEHEHEVEGERFIAIAQLTNNYSPPAEACNSFRVAYASLEEFERDLHRHIHLENNILFPKAIDLEKAVLQKL